MQTFLGFGKQLLVKNSFAYVFPPSLFCDALHKKLLHTILLLRALELRATRQLANGAVDLSAVALGNVDGELQDDPF